MLSQLTNRDVLAVYAEKDGDQFTIKRGYEKLIPGKNVLIVEDILTTGGSVKKVIEAVQAIGGYVVGVGAICNRGGVTAEDIGLLGKLYSLTSVDLESWWPGECPLCAGGTPVNTSIGKGKQFLAAQLIVAYCYASTPPVSTRAAFFHLLLITACYGARSTEAFR